MVSAGHTLCKLKKIKIKGMYFQGKIKTEIINQLFKENKCAKDLMLPVNRQILLLRGEFW